MNKLFVNAKVEASIVNNVPHILIEDKIEYTFSETSNITKLLHKSNLGHIQDILSDGTYLVIEDQLVDFRDSLYKDYINDKLKNFIFVMGYITNTPLLVNKGLRLRTFNHDITLGKYDCIDTCIINDDTYETGIFYNWSPFMSNIHGIPYVKRGEAIVFFHNAAKRLSHKHDWITYHNKQRETFKKEIRGMFETILLTLDTEDASEQEVIDITELYKTNNTKLSLPEDPTRYEVYSAALTLLPKLSIPGHALKYISTIINSAYE